jgi:hypothetical protein
MAAGRPVIALGRGAPWDGGASRRLRAATGLFFERQTVEDLVAAIQRLESERTASGQAPAPRREL